MANDIYKDFEDLKKSLPNLAARQLLFIDPTQNYDKTNNNDDIMIIVHHTVEPTLKGSKNAINSQKLSVHFFVDKDGSITLTVPLEKRAWHAGISYAKISEGNQVKELKGLNSCSIGIEIVNSGLEPFLEEQMNSVKDLILYLMKRFSIRKDMVFSHSEIGTIIYNTGLESYTMRKPDPHKLFDWELLEKNGIGLHINNRIDSKEAKQKLTKVLYKIGDKSENILELKKRLNNYFYKILPWKGKDDNIFFPDDQTKYTNEYDQVFAWVINQFSIHHLPKEIRKGLILKLEKEDTLPTFLETYAKNISSQFIDTQNKIATNLKSFLNKEDYNHLLNILKQYNDCISSDAFSELMQQIEIYYNSYLKYYSTSYAYHTFKDNALSKIDPLKKDITSMKSISSEKAQVVSKLIEQFQSNVLLEFENFEKKWFQEFQNEWKQKFIPNMTRQMVWTELHEEILQYLEKEKNKLKTTLNTKIDNCKESLPFTSEFKELT